MIDELNNYSRYTSVIRDHLGVNPGKVISVPLSAGGEFLGIVQAVTERDDPGLNSIDLNLLEAISERISLTLHNAWILEEANRALEEAKSLHAVGMALSGSLELDELLERILDNLKRVVEFEIGIIYLFDPAYGTIRRISSRGVPEADQSRLHLKIGQGICGRVFQTGESIIVSDVSSNTDYIAIRPQTRSEMAVPMKIDDNLIGVFNVESDVADAYNDHHLELMNGFASLAAVSIERARLHRERLVKRRIEHELSIARRIQMTFLPSKNPVVDGVDMAGINIPSAAVGGDYYDFIPIVKNQHGIAIGDVSGKGIPAALIMAAFRASLKAEIRNNFAIRTILQKVNRLLYESIERDRFVTAVYGVLDSRNKVFTFSNAGHNPPILRRISGEIDFLKDGGVALGALPGSEYQERPVSLMSGDILLFYTDGVTEVLNSAGEEFGVDRLLKALDESSHLDSGEIIDYIVKKTEKFRSSERDIDDLTMIVIKTL
jgi:serine phosphatase RsbU (regulator of sigma subunit)